MLNSFSEQMSDAVTAETVIAVVQAAKVNRHLQSLHLWSRHTSNADEGTTALLAIELLESNEHIRALDLGFATAPTGTQHIAKQHDHFKFVK